MSFDSGGLTSGHIMWPDVCTGGGPVNTWSRHAPSCSSNWQAPVFRLGHLTMLQDIGRRNTLTFTGCRVAKTAWLDGTSAHKTPEAQPHPVVRVFALQQIAGWAVATCCSRPPARHWYVSSIQGLLTRAAWCSSINIVGQTLTQTQLAMHVSVAHGCHTLATVLKQPG